MDWVLQSRQLGCLGLEQRASRVRGGTNLAATLNHSVFYDVEVQAPPISRQSADAIAPGSQQRCVRRTTTPVTPSGYRRQSGAYTAKPSLAICIPARARVMH
jgi:hypothetical protein